MTILVTGANGFVGSFVVKYLTEKGYFINACMRSPNGSVESERKKIFYINNLEEINFDHPMLYGVRTVIHTAARAHVMKETTTDPAKEFRRVNVQGTLNLAKECVKAGVGRFIFISSIKVNGEKTELGFPFYADQAASPSDPYSLSKYEAEEGLKEIAQHSNLEIVIVRPPLIYGPGVKGNLATLKKFLLLGLPLPLASIKSNRRSFVSLENLSDFLAVCIEHPNAANQSFLVSDGEDLSTAKLLKIMSESLSRRSRLFPMHPNILKILGKIFNKKGVVNRLTESLQVNIDKNRKLLGWNPRFGVIKSMSASMQND